MISSQILICLLLLLATGSSMFLEKNSCPSLADYMWNIIMDNKNCHHNPDVRDAVPGIILRHGYPIEQHNVTTSDGYILTIFRIPRSGAPPLLLQHGANTNSKYVLASSDRSLAFFLHDSGYDIWLGNFRGTMYSTGHTSHPRNSADYWNYSLDDIASHDIPSVMKYVTQHTKLKAFYIGHSMAGTLGLQFLIGQKEIAERTLTAMILVAPVVYMKNSPLFNIIGYLETPISFISWIFNIYALFYDVEFRQRIFYNLCSYFPYICLNVILPTVNGSPSNFPPEDLLSFFDATPDAIGIKVIRQYVQYMRRGKFAKFDYNNYGLSSNLDHYKTREPPEYNLSAVSIPVAMYYGSNDVFCPSKDVDHLITELPQELLTTLELDTFNHAEFFFPLKRDNPFYKALLEYLKEFSSTTE